MIETLVVGLHLRWKGVWQRPNHILSRFARRMRVIVVEEPLAAARNSMLTYESDGLTVVVPERRSASDAVDERTVEEVRRLAGGGSSLVWLYSPLMLGLAECAPGAPIVYDKMDELAAFKNPDPRLASREEEVLRRAAVVFAGGRSLWHGVRERAAAGAAIPSGVDVRHFARALSLAGPSELADLRGPVFGYVGVLDERLDLDLVASLARARPDATIVLVGPVAKIDAASLPRASNIRYLGKRDYDALPELIARFDVALMPFALNESTRYISPTKTLEYLAAGRPVVSTPVPDVVADFADDVFVATADGFVAAVRAAERADDERRARGLRRAANATWDAVVETMVVELARSGLALPSLDAALA